MKSSLLKVVVLALALGSTAFAATANKGNVRVSVPVQVAGTQLPAGDYVAKWDGTGPNVQVTFTQGKKVVATVPAQVVDLGNKPTHDTAQIKAGSPGSQELDSVEFSGKSVALKFGRETASNQ